MFPLWYKSKLFRYRDYLVEQSLASTNYAMQVRTVLHEPTPRLRRDIDRDLRPAYAYYFLRTIPRFENLEFSYHERRMKLSEWLIVSGDRGIRVGVIENDPRAVQTWLPNSLPSRYDPETGIRPGTFVNEFWQSRREITVSRIPMMRSSPIRTNLSSGVMELSDRPDRENVS